MTSGTSSHRYVCVVFLCNGQVIIFALWAKTIFIPFFHKSIHLTSSRNVCEVFWPSYRKAIAHFYLSTKTFTGIFAATCSFVCFLYEVVSRSTTPHLLSSAGETLFQSGFTALVRHKSRTKLHSITLEARYAIQCSTEPECLLYYILNWNLSIICSLETDSRYWNLCMNKMNIVFATVNDKCNLNGPAQLWFARGELSWCLIHSSENMLFSLKHCILTFICHLFIQP